MAITLDSNLATAQEAVSRKPIIELTSELIDVMPYEGDLINGVEGQDAPQFIETSTGVLVGLVRTIDTGIVDFIYSDAEKLSFYTAPDYSSSPDYRMFVADENNYDLVELSTGNIGIVYIRRLATDNGARYLTCRVVSPSGAYISSSDIATLTTATYDYYNLSLIKLANGSFVVMAARQVITTEEARFHRYTSANFSSWTDQGAVQPSGLSASDHKIDNPCLKQLTTGPVLLFFDYVTSTSSGQDLTNIHYMISNDNTTTWGSVIAVTSFDSLSERGAEPCVSVTDATHFEFLYTKISSALILDETDFGISGTPYTSQIVLDLTNSKLYVLCMRAAAGTKNLLAVGKVDMATFTVDKIYNGTSSPAINNHFMTKDIWWSLVEGDNGSIICWRSQTAIAVLDGQADTIKYYSIIGDTANGLDANIKDYILLNEATSYSYFGSLHYKAASHRIYTTIQENGNKWIHFGYIDINEIADTNGDYAWHELWSNSNMWTADYDYLAFGMSKNGSIKVYEEYNYVLISLKDSVFTGGRTGIYDFDGNMVCEYQGHTSGLTESYNTDYPLYGFQEVEYDGRYIYGVITYCSDVPEQNRRGMCIIDTITDNITYYNFTFATIDNAKCNQIMWKNSSTLLMATYGGVLMFNINTYAWTRLSDNEIPGITSVVGDNYFGAVNYDSINDIIYTGEAAYIGAQENSLIALSPQGNISQVYKMTATDNEGTWEFGTEQLVTSALAESNSSTLVDSDDLLNIFWQSATDDRTYWYRIETEGYDLTAFLVDDDKVTIKRSIEPLTDSLVFSLSHGHLFDPSNLSSIIASKLAKGRLIAVRIGETVSGVGDIWQALGSFVIHSVKLSYAKGKYPTIEVSCEDRSSFWEHSNIPVTSYYQTTPEATLESILLAFSGLEASEINLPTFDNGFAIHHQWVETSLQDIVIELCHRFQYFPKFDADGTFTATKIDISKATDHTYTDNTTIMKLTPDDSMAVFTNQVVVQGEERIPTEVVQPEERICSDHGTIGWWGCEKDKTVHYSTDKQRTVRNPRLVVLETATSIGFALAGEIEEDITFIDPNDKYCIVTIDAPNLIPLLLVAIEGVLDGAALGDATIGWGGGWTVPVGRIVEGLSLSLAFSILSSMGNWSYEIYGMPVGYVRRSIQRQADDIAHQALIREIISEEIDGFLCYTIAECQRVADYELSIVQAQRKRFTLEKATHLQDEVGDVISFIHPISSNPVKLFVTNIAREFSKSTGVVDKLQGWVL